MYLFDSDYTEGCIPEILDALSHTNLEQTHGYGNDHHCRQAAALIRQACNAPDARVHFLVGGTQTNTCVISHLLRPHQAVVCAPSGHINVHETGSVEHSGHKILPIAAVDRKLQSEDVDALFASHFSQNSPEHEAQPAMVYISFPTELGTIYGRSELEALSRTCRKWHCPLFIDGARLGYGLCADKCDVTLADIAALADVFYIGGTKQGALFGEAVVFSDPSLEKDFRYSIKQNGGLLAKGRLLGLQFATLFNSDCLYMKYSAHAVKQAMRIRSAFESRGVGFFAPSGTNQQFPVLENGVIEKLRRDFSFETWSAVDPHHTAVRFCTSWATDSKAVDALVSAVETIEL